MKKQILGLGLFAATAAAVAFYPALNSNAGTAKPVYPVANTNPLTTGLPAVVAQKPKIEVVFALDTTGSMSGLLAAAKENIWSIATTMAQADPAPEISMGIVAYRDRGDAYVTQVIDLSSDLDTVYGQLMDLTAAGGGDGPESVNEALADAVQKISWSGNSNTYKVVFLVGDAPPHMDYGNEMKYPEIVRLANSQGIIINAIRCGQDAATQQAWQTIASLSQGDYMNVDQSGSAVAIVTPFDRSIAELSEALDETRMVFGNDEEQARHAAKQAATEKLHHKASVASRARRATFNASDSGAKNFLGDNDLVTAVQSGRVDLTTVAAKSLPAPLRAMAPAEREAVIKKEAGKRSELKAKIVELAKQRDQFIATEIDARGGAKDSLDDKIYTAVKRQSVEAGMSYEAPAKY